MNDVTFEGGTRSFLKAQIFENTAVDFVPSPTFNKLQYSLRCLTHVEEPAEESILSKNACTVLVAT